MRNFFFAAAGLLAATSIQSAELLRYSFGSTGQETTVETSPVFNPTISGANFTATAVRDPNSTIGIESSSAATTPAGAPFLRVDPQGNSATPATALANGKYFEFTLTPDADFELNLESMTFDVTRGGASTPRGFFLRSSVDNFTTDLTEGDLPTARPNYTPVAVTF